MDFITAKTRKQVALCKKILFDFRTNLEDDSYMDLVMDMISKEAFELVYIANDDNSSAAAFVGYRTLHTLRTGRMIYIDDLYTDPSYRSKGYAGLLLDYVDQKAIETDTLSIHLDSGFTLHPAHKLYLNKGYVLGCHHFAKQIS